MIDERRNLVVAAAGSGKTSVIVAKTGWLVRKGYRKPSELCAAAGSGKTFWPSRAMPGGRWRSGWTSASAPRSRAT